LGFLTTKKINKAIAGAKDFSREWENPAFLPRKGVDVGKP